MLDYRNQQVYKWQADENYNEGDNNNISMIDESREASEDREEASWPEMRPTIQRTPRITQGGERTPTHRSEGSPIHRNRTQQEQSPNGYYQPNTVPRTQRIPKNLNRYSPLRYAHQDTPNREPYYRRDFFPRGHR